MQEAAEHARFGQGPFSLEIITPAHTLKIRCQPASEPHVARDSCVKRDSCRLGRAALRAFH